ncbi:MAG TPA: aldolase/citrate lyase family protein [Pseudonocardiaceae bacterium]
MNQQVFTGVAASSGVALGFAYRTDRDQSPALPKRTTGDPVQLITAAFDAVSHNMRELAGSLRSRGQCEQADIMDVAGYIADDPDLRTRALDHARGGSPVAIAVERAIDSYASILAELADPTLAERATDVRQIGRRVLAWLNAEDTAERQDGPLILLAHEIGAADLLEPPAPVVAAASVTGGPNSHAAIVARSLGIPLLLGISPDLLTCPDGIEILIDSEQASITVAPAPDERANALSSMDTSRIRRALLVAERGLPAQTRDGHAITLRANTATPADVRTALEAHAEGIGLLRTELPFLDATTWPSYLQHTAELTPIFRQLAAALVTVRTLDYADDKLPPFLATGREGQRLGRGLPLMLAAPDAFANQFRAILTAGAAADLRIMIPMVATAEELRACRNLLTAAATEARVAVPPLGAMIELPEAVADIESIAAEADFLSIGSNDLTCQILHLDRRDPTATPAMTAHPSVLRAISKVVTSAHRHRLPVSVCGDAAAHPQAMPLLVGLGCDILSVVPAAVDEVRARIRRLDHATCAATAVAALTCGTVEEVWRLVERHCLTALNPVESN